MKMKIKLASMIAPVLLMMGAGFTWSQQAGPAANAAPARPQGPCDVYAAAGDPCVAAHSTTRALYAGYNGPLYQVLRQSDGKKLNIGVVRASASPVPDAGGYADAAAQDAFCAGTYCWIATIYDQSPKHNHLTQAPRGGFSGPALGGFNNLPLADMAPVTVMGHKVYGVFIAPGTGLRNNDAKGTAVDDQAQGTYWVVNGLHFNAGCCFDYGNAEIDSHDDDNGTMETTYFGNAPWWYHGNPSGPWVMTDQENNLVGCVNPDGSNVCVKLPNIDWRFVTAMAKGEPHHWTSLGGDAQKGQLSVMFDGPRINATYDPMRKQGAILLGNGGDNSNGSQGTFYEGAMTASGTFPTDATDQLVQANVVAAHYGVQRLSMAPAAAMSTPPGLQTFTPGSSQQTTVTFTNTGAEPVMGVRLSVSAPGPKWTALVADTAETAKTFAGPVAPGASVSATFKVTSGPATFNGDLVGSASWTNQTSGQKQHETIAEKVRNVSPIKINEFRIGSGDATETDSFIELYNASPSAVDLSNWTLTEHPTQQAISSAIKIPSGTKLAAGGFYLLGLSNSGLAAASHAGDRTIYVRSTAGMKAGDSIEIGSGSAVETRKIASIGSAASHSTTVWQPVPEGPVITIAPGATHVPVEDTAGFVVGEKMALGHGATYPAVARELEQFEVVTVTSVGKPGTQAYLAEDVAAGASNIKVTSVDGISAGDTIRLDIDSPGHGIEKVTVARVGIKASQTNLRAAVNAGANKINVRNATGFAVGDKITVGTPASKEVVTVTAVGSASPSGVDVDIQPSLAKAHIADEWVVSPGTGLDLTAPLKFNHAANLPFSNRGTGIGFKPASAFAHSSNEPVQALGSGIVLDRPLAKGHQVNDVVRDAAVTTAGYQGSVTPNQWFGGPEFVTYAPQFGRTISVREGSMVLRDASGLVVDSLNYGGLVDLWAAQGYQAASGMNESGCRAPAPGPVGHMGPHRNATGLSVSAGRFPDGADTGSNCADFHTQTAAVLASASDMGATNIKVTNVDGFRAGQTIAVDTGSNLEPAVIASVGTPGATTSTAPVTAGETVIPVAVAFGFRDGQTVIIDSGANAETVVVASITPFPSGKITVATPLAHQHAAGVPVAGTGITLAAPLSRTHAGSAPIADNVSTPGAPNRYSVKH